MIVMMVKMKLQSTLPPPGGSVIWAPRTNWLQDILSL